jgi:hypothetical protein
MAASGPGSSQKSNYSSEWTLMPMSFHSSPRSSQQKWAAAITDSEPWEANKTKRGQLSIGINQFTYRQVRKVADKASITIRRKTLFDNPFLEDVDEMAAAAWMMACRLCKFDDSVPQQPALVHVAYAHPLDFLWYQC